MPSRLAPPALGVRRARSTHFWSWELVQHGWRVLEMASALCAQALHAGAYQPRWRRAFALYLVRDCSPLLANFTVFSALLTAVIARLVLSTAAAYGLSHLGLQLLIQVLALELIPFCATFFVATHCSIPDSVRLHQRMTHARRPATGLAPQGWLQPLHDHARARASASFCVGVLVTLLSGFTVLVVSYLSRYGLSAQGIAAFVRVLGQILTPPVCLVLVLKTVFSLLAVSTLPLAATLAQPGLDSGRAPGSAIRLLTLLMVAILVIEGLALLGHFY